MDFWKALRDLHEERRRLDTLIANLDALSRGHGSPRRTARGRKSMPPEERRIVSERMRAYWLRRRGNGGNEAHTASD
jgi:hypothetical protein